MLRCWFGLFLLVVMWISGEVAAWAGANPVITVTPTPPVVVGTGVTVGNTATATPSIQSDKNATVTLSVPATGDCLQFTVTPLSLPLVTGVSQQLTVTFTPTTGGNKSCTVSVLQGAVQLTTFDLTGSAVGTPVLIIDTTALAFVHVDIPTTGPAQTVTVTNNGTDTLTISSAAIVNQSVNYQVTLTSGSASLAPNAKATWSIACSPQAKNAVDDTFRIVSNDAAHSPQDVALTCSGDQGQLTLDMPTLNFGALSIGDHLDLPVKLTNTGNVTVDNITAALDQNGIGYTATPLTKTSLTAGDSETITVTFAPVQTTDGGPAKLTFTGKWGKSDAETSTIASSLSGQSIALAVPTTTLAFGDFRFDKPPSMTFEIQNNGSANIQISPLAFTADTGTTVGEVTTKVMLDTGTTVVDLSTTQTLAGGHKYVVTVTLTPNNRAGAIGGKFTVHSPLACFTNKTVTVTGNAQAAAFQVTNVDFGGVDVAATTPMTLSGTIKNTGNAALNLAAFTTAGATGVFTVTPPGAQQLQPGATLSINVAYKPTTINTAANPDTLTLTTTLTGALNGPIATVLTLKGRGIGRNLVIPAAPAGQTTFRNPGTLAPVVPITITNSGEAVLHISAEMVTGGMAWSVAETTPVDVAGGASQIFHVKFTPTEIGANQTGQFVLTSLDNTNTPVTATIPLTGTAEVRNVAFGSGPVNDSTNLIPVIDIGTTGVGAQLTVEGALKVNNLDPGNQFTIHQISLDSSAAFELERAPQDDPLPAGSTHSYAVTFAPTKTGNFTAIATLFLDQDPVPHAQVMLVGEAVAFDVRGGGGCDTGRGAGVSLVLVVVAAVAGTRRRRAVVVLLALSLPGTRALADDVHVGTFTPTPATSGTGIAVESAEVGTNGDWTVSSIVSYATKLLDVAVAQPSSRMAAVQPISHLMLLEVGGAYAFLGRFEAGFAMPFYDQNSSLASAGEPTIAGVHGTALGDLTLHGKAHLVDAGILAVGAAVHLTVPTATDHQFVGEAFPTLRALALATVAASPRLTLSFSGGAVLRKTADYAQTIFLEQRSGLVWGAGASMRVTRALFATGELFGDALSERVVDSNAHKMTLSPIEMLVGASYYLKAGVAVGIAVGRGVTDAPGAPGFRGTFTLSFTRGTAVEARSGQTEDLRLASEAAAHAQAATRDRDGDGIPDAADRCPNEPEDKDGFQDEDGCPDPDNDLDDIPDVADKCPDQPETFNGIDDEDGCPETVEPIPVESGMSARDAANETFKRGRALFADKQYLAACAAFEQSLQLDPAAGTKYNLAGCDAQIGKVVTALRLYRELAQDDKNAERRAKSDELARQLVARLPKLKLNIKHAPAGTTVTVDGRTARELVDGELPVDLGIYAVEVSAPGYTTWRKQVVVKHEGEVAGVDVDLNPDVVR